MAAFHPQDRAGDRPSRLALALYRIGQAVQMMLRRRAQAHGLSAAQLQALLFLAHARPGVRTVSGLAQRLGATMATASEVADALERKGLIARAPWPAHRRTIILRLTPQGEALVPTLEGALEDLEGLLRDLPEPDQIALERILQEVVRRLAAAGHVAIYEMCWGCAFFRPHAHPDDPRGPHHCAFMNAPLPEADTYTECPDFIPREVEIR
ncbi:MAG: MarR family transcriptional regulator [Thermoflexus sp.]|uniref:MarR family winged helix-turn-helix transcriptional regulator n=1 Tax=Thermoflexus sp. TaxID=1969742 RepID=UPI003326720C